MITYYHEKWNGKINLKKSGLNARFLVAGRKNSAMASPNVHVFKYNWDSPSKTLTDHQKLAENLEDAMN